MPKKETTEDLSVKAWAVIDLCGKPVANAVGSSRRIAQNEMLGGSGMSWNDLEKLGYRVARVVVKKV